MAHIVPKPVLASTVILLEPGVGGALLDFDFDFDFDFDLDLDRGEVQAGYW